MFVKQVLCRQLRHRCSAAVAQSGGRLQHARSLKRSLSSQAHGAAEPPTFASVQKDLIFLPEMKEAQSLRDQGLFHRAIPLLERAETILESSMGPGNLMAQAVRYQRGTAYLEGGDFAKGEAVLQTLTQTLEMGRHSAVDVVVPRLLMGGAALLQGHVDRAHTLATHTLQLVEAKAESHTSLLSRSLQLLGVIELYRAQHDDAYELLQKAARLAGCPLWQCRTSSSLGMYHFLGSGHKSRDEGVKEAIALWEETLEGLQRPEGDAAAPRDVSSCVGEAELWVNLATAQLWEGEGEGEGGGKGKKKKRDLKKAEEAASRALKLQESAKLGDTHPTLGRTLAVIARHRHLIGQAVSSEGLYRAALDSLRQPTATTCPALRTELQSVLRNYALLLKEWDRREKDAEQLEKEAQEIDILQLSPDVPVCPAIYIEGVGTLAEKDTTPFRADAMTLHVLRDLPVRNKANFSRLCLGRPLISSPPLYTPTHDTSPMQTIGNEPFAFGLHLPHGLHAPVAHPQERTETGLAGKRPAAEGADEAGSSKKMALHPSP